MLPYLKKYPSLDAHIVEHDFRLGFPLHFEGPPLSYVVPNHKSALQHPAILRQKVKKELELGRIKGPFSADPLPNCRSSLTGLVPKKSENPDPMSTDNWRFIHDLTSYPKGESVNPWVPEEFSSVKYASLDSVIDKLTTLGPGALMAKVDCKSAFWTIPMYVESFNLLGFSLDKFIQFNTFILPGYHIQ